MFKLLMKMALLPPALLKSHALGYVDLASDLGSRYLCTLKNKWVMYLVSVLSGILALIFGGVAWMLWSTLVMPSSAQPWVLWALPSACALISALCWWRARSLALPTLLQDIQSQLQLDLQMVQRADTP
jgi:hypothetical protein